MLQAAEEMESDMGPETREEERSSSSPIGNVKKSTKIVAVALAVLVVLGIIVTIVYIELTEDNSYQGMSGEQASALGADQQLLYAMLGAPDRYIILFGQPGENGEPRRVENWVYSSLEFFFSFENGSYTGGDRTTLEYADEETIDEFRFTPMAFTAGMTPVEAEEMVGEEAERYDDAASGKYLLSFRGGALRMTFTLEGRLVNVAAEPVSVVKGAADDPSGLMTLDLNALPGVDPGVSFGAPAAAIEQLDRYESDALQRPFAERVAGLEEAREYLYDTFEDGEPYLQVCLADPYGTRGVNVFVAGTPTVDIDLRTVMDAYYAAYGWVEGQELREVFLNDRGRVYFERRYTGWSHPSLYSVYKYLEDNGASAWFACCEGMPQPYYETVEETRIRHVVSRRGDHYIYDEPDSRERIPGYMTYRTSSCSDIDSGEFTGFLENAGDAGSSAAVVNGLYLDAKRERAGGADPGAEPSILADVLTALEGAYRDCVNPALQDTQGGIYDVSRLALRKLNELAGKALEASGEEEGGEGLPAWPPPVSWMDDWRAGSIRDSARKELDEEKMLAGAGIMDERRDLRLLWEERKDLGQRLSFFQTMEARGAVMPEGLLENMSESLQGMDSKLKELLEKSGLTEVEVANLFIPSYFSFYVSDGEGRARFLDQLAGAGEDTGEDTGEGASEGIAGTYVGTVDMKTTLPGTEQVVEAKADLTVTVKEAGGVVFTFSGEDEFSVELGGGLSATETIIVNGRLNGTSTAETIEAEGAVTITTVITGLLETTTTDTYNGFVAGTLTEDGASLEGTVTLSDTPTPYTITWSASK